MRSDVKSFFAGAFLLIGLFLVLAHAGGFAQALTAGAAGSSTVFRTLQGR